MPVQRSDPKVFFPWERRRGLRSVFRRARARQGLLAIGGLASLLFLRYRELGAAEVRSTRATITTATRAVAAWRADHELKCPPLLSELVTGGYLADLPRDAWGRLLRVGCPGRRDPRGFDVTSDGPDGLPSGLDRVE